MSRTGEPDGIRSPTETPRNGARPKEETDWDADGRPRYRIDDQGSDPRRRGDDPRSCRRWRPLRRHRDLGNLPRQVPRAAAPDRLPVAARPDGRGAARAGAPDRSARGLVPMADNPRGA